MKNQSKKRTAAVVDGIVKFLATGGYLTTILVAPRAVEIFDKPVMNLLEQLDERERQRELKRIVYYMKNRGLIAYNPNDYEHGIKLTGKGKKRLQDIDYKTVSIARPHTWDGRWRLVIFDIPEEKKEERRTFSKKLISLGYKRLQYSAWVHPFPSRDEIALITQKLQIQRYVSYLEVINIDSEKALKRRFKNLL